MTTGGERTIVGFGVVSGLGRWLMAACVLSSFLHCQSGGPKVEKTIGAAGGTVEATDGTSVEIPAGALTSDVKIGVSLLQTAPAPRGATLLGPVYLMTPEGQRFDKPVRVSVSWSMAKLPMGRTAAEVQLYTSGNVPNALLSALPARTVNATTVSAETDHFSLFLVAVPDGTPGGPDGGTTSCPLMMDTQGACGQCLRQNCLNEYVACYGDRWDQGDATGGSCGSFNRCNCDCNDNATCLEQCMNMLQPSCTACQDAVSTCNEKCIAACAGSQG